MQDISRSSLIQVFKLKFDRTISTEVKFLSIVSCLVMSIKMYATVNVNYHKTCWNNCYPCQALRTSAAHPSTIWSHRSVLTLSSVKWTSNDFSQERIGFDWRLSTLLIIDMWSSVCYMCVCVLYSHTLTQVGNIFTQINCDGSLLLHHLSH